MSNYTPFLKLKANEIGALNELDDDIKDDLIPFFDFPTKKGMTSTSFAAMVDKVAKSIVKNLPDFQTFYLDNFDIDDKIRVNKADNYLYVIGKFADLEFIPVVGLDREPNRNQMVFDAKRNGDIKSDSIAIRLQSDDFEDFELVRDEIEDLFTDGSELFSNWVLVLDNRVCLSTDVTERSKSLAKFLTDIEGEFSFSEIIISGSSIPASISEILPVESDLTHERKELTIYREVAKAVGHSNISLGDYTVVSPLYSDISIPPEAMRNVTAPKIVYSYKSVHYIARGGALASHARGNLQYNDIAKYLIGLPFFRGAPYSFGDRYLDEKGNFRGSQVTPSSILKPTINAHMTYMYRTFTV
jgi:hypothetical protein